MATGVIGYDCVPTSKVPVVVTAKGHQSVGRSESDNAPVGVVESVLDVVVLDGLAVRVDMVGEAQKMFL